MQMKWLRTVAYFAFAGLSGCAQPDNVNYSNPLLAPGTETGSFCSQLVHVIVRGTESPNGKGYFGALRGARIDDNLFAGKIKIGNAENCYVDYSFGKFHAKYTCIYGDAPSSEYGKLVRTLNQLEAEIDTCLVERDVFNFNMHGKSRYFNAIRRDDSVVYYDRWRHQSVEVKIEDADDFGRLFMVIDSL
jgi:hypothetical protein